MLEKMGKGRLHFSLIDPVNQTPEEAGEIAERCEQYGSDAIMVGGSTVKSREETYRTIEGIKKRSKLPVIIFPNSASMIAENADYILFMDLVNSLDYKYHKGEQLKGAKIVKKYGIKPIATAYIVISTSSKPTTVERKANLDRIGIDDIEKLIDYALYSEYIGFDVIYLEAGSNAERPVPDEMVRVVRKETSVPIMVGGGIKDGEAARRKIEAGASVVVTGSLLEENVEKLKEIIDAIKE
ncbi:MAG: geranylgeranylglyceryl/heptaprenylglyceryl phosphate synthase [Thermoplasmata archaeon]|nr:geranylgeranylglyceryl/heptaprenylglyceryl phosphate synthase [Thermoplasmata archaeon]